MAHAEAYKDPGTPEEQSRRTFMANAVIALGGVIGISLAIPLVTSLVPPPGAGNEAWSSLTPQEVDLLKKATDNMPVKVTFNVHEVNGYFGATDAEQFVWGGVAKLVPSPFAQEPLVIGPVSVLPLRLFVLATTLHVPVEESYSSQEVSPPDPPMANTFPVLSNTAVW